MLFISGCGNSDASEWKASQSFFVKEGDHYISLIGNKDELGFQVAEQFQKNSDQAVKWVFIKDWENTEGKSISIKATHKDNDQDVVNPLINATAITKDQAIEGVTQSLTTMKFTEAGIWKVTVEVDRKLYGSIVVEVLE